MLICCAAHKESVRDINLTTGMSPAIQRRWEHQECSFFEEGESCCEIPKGNPFDVPKIRLEGEKYYLSLFKH